MSDDAIRILTGMFPAAPDHSLLEYIAGLVSDEDFDWGDDCGYEHLGPFLLDGGMVNDETAAREACRRIQLDLGSERNQAAGYRALDQGPIVLSMSDTRKLTGEELKSGKSLITQPLSELPTISEKDKLKIEKTRQREDQQARAAFEAHQAQAQAHLKGSLPTIIRNQGSQGCKDIHLEDFNISAGGKDLIVDANMMLAYGRRYGLVGRNGTGKTTLLRSLSSHEIKGIPLQAQILHVEQEVVGDDMPVIEAVLSCDVERNDLLAEEKEILAKLNNQKPEDKTVVDKVESELSARLVKVYERLEAIDASGAESRAAVILAGLSFDSDMMRRATKTFSGGWRMRVALARALFVEPDLLLLE